MTDLFTLLILFIYFASIVSIFVVLLIFKKQEIKHKELKFYHVYRGKLISEEEAKKYQIERYKKIDNVIFVYYVKRR